MPTYLKYELYFFLHFDSRSDPDPHFFQSDPVPDPWKKNVGSSSLLPSPLMAMEQWKEMEHKS